LSNQLNPNLGPYDLTDDIGPGSGLGQLSNPIGIALSSDGKIVYVVDSGNQRVERYTSDGKYVGVWDAGTNSALDFATQFGQGPQGITTSGDLVYVADTWNHRVVVLDQNGQVVRELGQKGVVSDNADSPDPALNPGKFYGPRDIAVDNGEIYVVDTGNERVEVFAQDGTFLRAFGGFGTDSGKMVEPTGIAIGPDGNVYVADSGNGRISVFTKSGSLVREIPMSQWQGQSTRTNYLAFGPTGLLYATDPDAGAIDVIDPGTGTVVYTGSGPANESIKQPSGIAVASDGTIWVVDTSASKVVHFTLDLPPATQGTPIAATPAASPGATPAGSPLGPLEIPATPAP
jgi:DNA-binding beta-propeller fold protein YncE